MIKNIVFTSLLFLFLSKISFANDLQRAQAVYSGKCAICHGENGEGSKGEGPSLNNKNFLELASDDYLKKVILNGREDTQMKFSHRKSKKIKAHIQHLLTYIRSWEKNYKDFKRIKLDNSLVVKGNNSNGKMLYNNNCVKCHLKDGSGYANGFKGENIGTAIRFKDFLAQSSDDFIKHTIERGRINPDGKILMPPFLSSFGASKKQALKEQEINDIIVYLRSK